MVNSLRRQKNFLNQMFLKKFKLIEDFETLTSLNLDGNDRCSGQKNMIRRENIQQRINDTDRVIEIFMENIYGN